MLLKNKSFIEKIIHLELEYDDGTIKKGCIKKGTKMHLTFRRDGRRTEGYGKVVDIKESSHCGTYNTVRSSSAIVFNMSHCFRCKEYLIKLDDILDFRVEPPMETIGPEKGKLPMPIVGRKEKCHDKKGTPAGRGFGIYLL